MAYAETINSLNEYRRQVGELHGKMRELQAGIEPQPVQDYEFATQAGPVQLSALFGDKDSLFVIHNMGAACMYCTLWADGLNGFRSHLENRAAFVVSSPDAPAAQQKFSDNRGWTFRMVSHQDSSFAKDMGYQTDAGLMPGISVYKKNGTQIVRVSDTWFGPGDDFCSLWALYDLLPEGADGWQPQQQY